jgi:hypothetical protein
MGRRTQPFIITGNIAIPTTVTGIQAVPDWDGSPSSNRWVTCTPALVPPWRQ